MTWGVCLKPLTKTPPAGPYPPTIHDFLPTPSTEPSRSMLTDARPFEKAAVHSRKIIFLWTCKPIVTSNCSLNYYITM